MSPQKCATGCRKSSANRRKEEHIRPIAMSILKAMASKRAEAHSFQITVRLKPHFGKHATSHLDQEVHGLGADVEFWTLLLYMTKLPFNAISAYPGLCNRSAGGARAPSRAHASRIRSSVALGMKAADTSLLMPSPPPVRLNPPF